jgi:pyridoxal phosphate enzyme (YggS family)
MTPVDPQLVEQIARRKLAVDDRIRNAGGDPSTISLIAVTKTFPVDVAVAAVAAGLTELWENYPQELASKARDPFLEAARGRGDLRWHAIGQLQRNKINLIAPFVSLWQTVDTRRLAEAIAKRVPGARVLVQVNLTDDPARGGAEVSGVSGLVDDARRFGLRVEGLMAVGPPGEPEASRLGFRSVRSLVDGLGLRICCMGMTSDLEIAVQEGATMIRVGSALFGERPRQPTDAN